jgi:protein-tyrosine phosphatase
MPIILKGSYYNMDKIKIMFVCHGNICRSPMAEFVFKDIAEKNRVSDKFIIESSATSTEEIGNPVHYGTRNKLKEYNISCEGKYAVQLEYSDYPEYDYIIGMDNRNIRNIMHIIKNDSDGKVFRLLDFTERKGHDIADPWYTGNFDETYNDIFEGCTELFRFLTHKFR